MGWNFGGAIVDYDFRNAVRELDPALRRMVFGHESPEAKAAMALIDAGNVALAALGIAANSADAPISFLDAASVAFDDFAVGVVDTKTVVLGKGLGLDQDPRRAIGERVSSERGPMLAFWFNDASDTYLFSMFRDGARIRYRSRGTGLADDEGSPLPGEPTEPTHPHHHQMRVLEAFARRSFKELLGLQLERFDAA